MCPVTEIQKTVNDTALQRCLDAAYRYLTYRARSEAELKQHLHGRGFSTEVLEETMVRLKEQSLIDDLAFAQFWRDNRLSSNPKSKRLIAQELKEKKVTQETIEQVIENIDDEENAYKLGRRRIHMFLDPEHPNFQRKLSNYLAYRGFSYDVIRQTVSRLWQEKQGKT